MMRFAHVSAIAVPLAALASGCDHAQPPTSPEGAQAGEISAPASLTFAQVSAGSEHSCGVTTTNAAYCWGYNGWGQLGDGTAVEAPTDPVLDVDGRTTVGFKPEIYAAVFG